jgi:DNA polymerase I-like protein with 3'-5' exonuclease and polymerase domains
MMDYATKLPELLPNLKPVCVDVETTAIPDNGNLDDIDNVWCISWSFPDGSEPRSVYWKEGVDIATLRSEFEQVETRCALPSISRTHDYTHWANLLELKQLLNGDLEGYVPSFHNASFDSKILRKATDIPKYHCTAVMGYVAMPPSVLGLRDEGGASRLYRLAEWGKRGFCSAKQDYDDGWEAFSERMLNYNKQDAVAGTELAVNLLAIVSANSQSWDIYLIDLCAQEALINREGVHIDLDATLEVYRRSEQTLTEKLDELMQLVPAVGVKEVRTRTEKVSYKMTTKKLVYQVSEIGKFAYVGKEADEFIYVEVEAFRPGSSRHMIDALIAHCEWKPKKFSRKTGLPTTDKSVLKELSNEHQFAALVLEYRKYSKLISTYLKPYREGVDKHGKLYPSFPVTSTRPGRLASSNPNFQNIPKEDVRHLIIARPGCKVVCVDLSQIELRILAWYMYTLLPEWETTREYLWKVYHVGADVHEENRKMMGLADNERRLAKIGIFLYIYGGGEYRFSQSLFVPLSKAVSMLKGLEAKVPALPSFKRKVLTTYRNQGFIRTMYGRLIHYPDFNSKNRSYRLQAERQIINAVIQGTQADIIKLIMWKVLPVLTEYSGNLLMQVHDELVFEVPEGLTNNFCRKIVPFFNNKVLLPGLPIKGMPGIGDSWDEAKKDGEEREKAAS